DPGRAGSPEDNYDASCTCIRWLNPAAWTGAAAFTLGGTPRTDPRVRTPLRTNWDVAFHKTQPIGAARVSLRVEIINLFDDPAFGGPRVGQGLPVFGQIVGVSGFPRTVQLTAKLSW